MESKKRIPLQFFAGEGAAAGEGGGEGAATADVSAASAQQTDDALERMGVPKEKLERYRARKGQTGAAAGAEPAQKAPSAAPAAEAAENEQQSGEETGEPTAKTARDRIRDDPELNSEVQRIVNERLKKYAQSTDRAKDELKKLDGALKLLAKRYGVPEEAEGKLDLKTLGEKILNDDSLFEDMAEELGTEPAMARQLYQRDQELAAVREREREALEEKANREHFDKLWQQGEELKKVYPGFDLVQEMQNEQFRRMVMPSGGLSVQQAYQALHYQELRQAEAAAITERVQRAVAANIAAGQQRPAESGRAQSASLGSPRQDMSKESRDEIKRRIREAAARGEKIYPGR